MPKVIITGINGFVGKHLVEEFVSQGYEVTGVGREEQLSQDLSGKVESYYSCDLADFDSVKTIPFANTAAIINLAGLAAVGPSFDNPELYMRVNTAVLDTVCRAILEQQVTGVRIISISSGAIYSSSQPMPLTEESRLAPESSPYAASKIAMEELSRKYRTQGIDCVIARPFNHIGPGQLAGFLLPDLYSKVVAAQASGADLLVGNLSTKRDYTDVRDVAKAYVDLVHTETLKNDTYNVCTGRSVSGEEILAILLQTLGANMKPVVDTELFRPSDAPELFGSNTKITTDTGWTPSISLEQTIQDFVTSMS